MRSARSNNPARVVLVAYEDQENLGVRYLAARLREAGHSATIVPYSEDHQEVSVKVERERPHMVGLSLIFQFFLPKFRSLAVVLRERCRNAHITIGGHFPSFEPEVVLRQISCLDSVVLFEGEETLLELSEAVASGVSWKKIRGIAFIDNNKIVKTQARAPLKDLTLLPWPDREDKIYDERFSKAAVLGSRGCPWRCSFCSITNFYTANGTNGRRLREPLDVADELEYLSRKKGIRTILWQDDEFLGGGKRGVEWAHALAAECIKKELHRKLKWKISCRSDSVTRENLAPLVEAGLAHVYLGVESGDQQSLGHLNKCLSSQDHFKAKEVIIDFGLSFDFGFMLMEPWSTMEAVHNNISFLRKFSSDGSAIAGFCRMLPYAGTTSQTQLAKEGRLRLYEDSIPDYNFLDKRLDFFYDWAFFAFQGRNLSKTGAVSLLRAALFAASMQLDQKPDFCSLLREIHDLVAVSNNTMIDLLELALDHIEGSWPFDPGADGFLADLTRQALREEELTSYHATRILAALQGGEEMGAGLATQHCL